MQSVVVVVYKFNTTNSQACINHLLQGFAEPLHRAEKRKALHITYITIHTMYIDKHATLDALRFQHDAKILQNPVVATSECDV